MVQTVGLSALDESAAPLQAVVDAQQAKNTALYTQRDALKQQIMDLVQQRNVLEQQITASEGSDVKSAREGLAALEMIKLGRGSRGPIGIR